MIRLSRYLRPVRLKSGRTVNAVLASDAESGNKLLYCDEPLPAGERFVCFGTLYCVGPLVRRHQELRVYHVRPVVKAAQTPVS